MRQRRDERETNRFGARVYRRLPRIRAPHLKALEVVNNVSSRVFEGARDPKVEGSVETSNSIEVEVGMRVGRGEATRVKMSHGWISIGVWSQQFCWYRSRTVAVGSKQRKICTTFATVSGTSIRPKTVSVTMIVLTIRLT